MGYYGFRSYRSQPTVAELKKKAQATIARLQKAGRDPHPVASHGRSVATTWWGKAWCENLARYADFSNRVGRGKRYVNAGCVVDLEIRAGAVEAVVQGSRKDPYLVAVSIDPMDEAVYKKVVEGTTARARSLDALAAGDFPEELKGILFDEECGVFPAPRQIHMGCSCPDGAWLCKHVAAALYGVGAYLDDEPLLLFKLRGIDVDALIRKTVEDKLASMLENADVESPRVLDIGDAGLTELFGVL